MEKLALEIGKEFWLKPQAGISDTPAYQSIGGFISAILPNVYVLASIIVFIFIVIAGLMFIINAGKGESEAAKKWQGTLTASLIGFLIIFASYWIMQIIKVVTGLDILGF